MESVLNKACTIKIQNFEGPFDLLFHLIEKNQVNIYDIPVNEITDQYMEYLFAMQTLDLEIASEFLVMASTLLHIKSRLLLPDKKENMEEEEDPREQLVMRLIEYKKYKEFSKMLKQREADWSGLFYKLPEVMEFKRSDEVLELSVDELIRVYTSLIEKNRRKMNNQTGKMAQIIKHEKVSLRSKMRELIRHLLTRAVLIFSEVFPQSEKSRPEVVTGFLAILELSKLKKVRIDQERQFSDIVVSRTENGLNASDMEDIAAEG